MIPTDALRRSLAYSAFLLLWLLTVLADVVRGFAEPRRRGARFSISLKPRSALTASIHRTTGRIWCIITSIGMHMSTSSDYGTFPKGWPQQRALLAARNSI